jgi:ABC-2 type transport system ATP-binding protein
MAVIEVDHPTNRYGPILAVDDVTFTCRRGTVTGFLGPNASDKTTAVSILSTALRADSGQTSMCGFDVRTQGAAVRRQIGFAGQQMDR